MSEIINQALAMSFIRLREVLRITGKSRSALYDSMLKNEFPRPVPIGKRQVAWTSTSIEQWQKSCIEASNRPQE